MNDVFRIDFEVIEQRAIGQWPSILSHFCPSISDLVFGRDNGSFCPFHGGNSGKAFHLLKRDFEETGGCGCNSCGEFPRGFHFIARLNNLAIEKAYQAVAKFIFSPAEYEELNSVKKKGSRSSPKKKATQSKPAASKDAASKGSESETIAARIKLGANWQAAQVDPGRIKAYLTSRGLTIDPPPTLRFHDSLYYAGQQSDGEEKSGNFPAMIAKLEKPSSWVAEHVTYLSMTGDGKLEVEDPKKVRNPIKPQATTGSAIYLYPVTPQTQVMFIAEGIETALAIRQAFVTLDIPVWATGSAHNTEHVEIPQPSKTIGIWADHDPKGEEAAVAAADRLTREGHKCFILKFDSTHDDKTDALDVLNEPELGESYLRAMWDEALKSVPHNPAPAWEGKDPKDLTDVQLANMVLPIIKPFHRRVEDWNCWMGWDGKRWVRNAGRLLREALQKIGTDGGDTHPLQSTNRINKVITELSAKSELNIDYSRFDQQPFLLNCENGTVDLRTGEVTAHNPDHLLTHLVPHVYDQTLTDEACPNWIKTLSLTWPANEANPSRPELMASFFQRLCGYTLTGSTQEQIITILHGSGSNGKSTIVDVIQSLMGEDIAITLPSSLVTVRREEHPTALASLFTRRMAYSVETGEQARLNEESMKRLSGSDRILARRMNENFWGFKPSHKVWIATNHKPKIQGTDHAIWRRLVLVPFEQTYWSAERGESGPEEYRQIKHHDRVLLAEIPGILAWAIRGAIAWARDGLCQPGEVTLATQQYRDEEDLVGQFIEERCINHSSVSCKSSELFKAWSDWCEKNGEHPRSNKYLSQKVQEKGFTLTKSRDGRIFQHIAIKPSEAQSDDY